MYEYGGLYLDIMSCPRDELDMDVLFSRLEHKSTYVAVWGGDLGFSLLLSKPKTPIMEELYDVARRNMTDHYNKEISSDTHIDYNLVTLTGPVLFHDVVVNKPFSGWGTYLDPREDSPQNEQYLGKWDCDLIDLDKTVWLYKVGFDNHHGKNMDKHWSRQQTKKKLFG